MVLTSWHIFFFFFWDIAHPYIDCLCCSFSTNPISEGLNVALDAISQKSDSHVDSKNGLPESSNAFRIVGAAVAPCLRSASLRSLKYSNGSYTAILSPEWPFLFSTAFTGTDILFSTVTLAKKRATKFSFFVTTLFFSSFFFFSLLMEYVTFFPSGNHDVLYNLFSFSKGLAYCDMKIDSHINLRNDGGNSCIWALDVWPKADFWEGNLFIPFHLMQCDMRPDGILLLEITKTSTRVEWYR